MAITEYSLFILLAEYSFRVIHVQRLISPASGALAPRVRLSDVLGPLAWVDGFWLHWICLYHCSKY